VPDDRPYLRPLDPSGLGLSAWLTLLAVVVSGAFGAFYLWQKNQSPPPMRPSTPAGSAPVAPAASAPPAVRYPLQALDSQALPALDESDAAIWAALGGLFNGNSYSSLLRSDQIVRRIVATVDNLPRKYAPARMMPMKPVPGKFRVGRSGITLAVAAENSARYRRYVRLAQSIDARKLAAAYLRFYPAFQEAYVELGYPNGYFNDRLVEAIDDLLEAPQTTAPIRLVQPRILYLFQSEELEARSAGQKIMVRMGNENAAKVKAKLREIRAEIVHHVNRG
jgi:hypothetical protein